MATHLNIMRNMHQIIELAALANDRVAQGTSVNQPHCRLFHISLQNNATNLRNFHMAASRCKAEPVAAYIGAAMNNHAVTQQGIGDSGIGAHRAIAAQHHAMTDMCMAPI